MKFNQCILGVALMAVALTGCSNEEQLTLSGTSEARTPLAISVTNSGLTKVGGVVSGSQFGNDVSLGLFLTKEDGSSPYDEPYNNIEYVSSNSGQTWTASTPILLTGTKAKVYAYYPYSSSVTNIEAIPIDVTQNQDVMWATPYSGAYNASPTATLPMNHALSVIRFSLSKGDYSGAGNITSITIKGDCMAKTGSLNAKTGAVTPTDAGAEIDLGVTKTVTTAAQTVEQLVIPTTASGNISVTIQMDDKTFEATSSAPITPTQSKAYKFGLVFTDSKLTMSDVSIGAITEVSGEDMTPIVNRNPWANFTTSNDGVYGIKEDGSPMPYNEAKTTSETLKGVAIVMYGRALQISNSQLSSQRWGSTSVNISGIPDVTVVGGGSTESHGYLAGTSTPQLNKDYTTWLDTDNTALADTAGWSHTEALIAAQSGLAPSGDYIGVATTNFRNGANNQGYSDWFIPAEGQLAYMYLKRSEINTLLGKCDGATPIPTTPSSSYHWSSSEYSTESAWYVNFQDGNVNYICTYKKYTSSFSVRFCREL